MEDIETKKWPTRALAMLAWRQPHFARYEWLVIRFGLAWLVWLTVSSPPGMTEQPAPIGLAHYMDLTWIGQVDGWRSVALVMVVLYALGWLPLLSTGVLLAMHVFIGTLVNSQGAIHHTTQIVGYLLLAQLLCHFRHALKPQDRVLDPVRMWRHAAGHARRPLHWLGEQAAPGSRANDWVWYSLQMAAAVYVVCGVSKLLRSGFDWVRDIPNIPLQFEKNQLMWYYNTLEEQASRTSEFAVQVTINYPLLAQVFFSIGLILELTAFMILWRRWSALLWGIGLFMLHVFVRELMSLNFFFNKTALVLLVVNVPFWLVAGGLWLRGRRGGGMERTPSLNEPAASQSGTTEFPKATESSAETSGLPAKP